MDIIPPIVPLPPKPFMRVELAQDIANLDRLSTLGIWVAEVLAAQAVREAAAGRPVGESAEILARLGTMVRRNVVLRRRIARAAGVTRDW